MRAQNPVDERQLHWLFGAEQFRVGGTDKSKNETRRANTDWDWKRDLQADGSSKPFENIGDVYRHREAAAIVRKRGNRATREAVKLNLAGVKIHGGS